MAHIDEVRELAIRKKPLIIILTETCATSDLNDSEIVVE